MTDMTRTLKMIADCDDEVHFERQVKRELLRLHDLIVKADALTSAQAARIAELEANLKRNVSNVCSLRKPNHVRRPALPRVRHLLPSPGKACSESTFLGLVSAQGQLMPFLRAGLFCQRLERTAGGCAMTRDEIMALAEKVGLTSLSLIDVEYLGRFAELVAAAEREACFRIAITIGDHSAGCRHTDEVAAAIRARGEQ